MQVETIYKFKNYLYIAKSGFLSQNKVFWLSIISYPTRARGIIVKYVIPIEVKHIKKDAKGTPDFVCFFFVFLF